MQVQAYVANRPRSFRLVSASEYLRTFASTRKHMVNPEGAEGKWLADPPVYPPITCELGDDTLEMFLDFEVPNGTGWGRIVDEEGFWNEFASEDKIEVEEKESGETDSVDEKVVRVHC